MLTHGPGALTPAKGVEMASKRNLLWVEGLRTVAMLLVVAAHVNDASYLRAGSRADWSIFISAIGVWAVPAFFMVAGFLLGRKAPGARAAGDLAAFTRRKLTTLIIPFLVWNLIYMLIFKLMYGWPVLSLTTVWFMLTGYNHLYFVFVLLQFFFLYQLIGPLLTGRALSWVLGLAAALTLGFYAVSDLLLWMNGNDHHFFEWHYGKIFVGWSLFFFWGVWLGRRPAALAWLARWAWPLAGLSLAGFALYFWETRVEIHWIGTNARQIFLLSGLLCQLLMANCALGLAQRLIPAAGGGGVRGWLVRAGGDTFGVYMCHLAFIIFLTPLWSWVGLPEAPGLKIPVLVALVWLLSQGLVRLLRRPGLGRANALVFGGRG